jgi:hypothetical protein
MALSTHCLARCLGPLSSPSSMWAAPWLARAQGLPRQPAGGPVGRARTGHWAGQSRARLLRFTSALGMKEWFASVGHLQARRSGLVQTLRIVAASMFERLLHCRVLALQQVLVQKVWPNRPVGESQQ